jgi:hypothetical protein
MNYKYLTLEGPYKKKKKPHLKAWLIGIIVIIGIAIVLLFL